MSKDLQEQDFTKAAPTNPEAGEQWQLVQRIAASAIFSRSHRLRDFLLYIGGRTVEERTAEITEQQIGVHVFGRAADYSPAEDNIVRSTARMLRVRLREYFETQGALEPWRMEIPKGSYIPVFVPVARLTQQAPISKSRSKRAFLAALILAGLAAALAIDNIRLRTARQGDRTPSLWNSAFDRRSPVQVVLPDGSLGIINSWTRNVSTLEQYASGKVWEVQPPATTSQDALELWRNLAHAPMVGYETVNVVFRTLQSPSTAGVRLNVLHARNMQLRDFKTQDLLVLGGPRANPWSRLFEASLNFGFESNDGRSLAVVRNRHPNPGEAAAYITEIDEKRTGRAYARIAALPNLSGAGRVLLLAGTTADATEAAGEFVTDPKALEEFRRIAGASSGREPGRFEILLETAALAGTPKGYRVVGWRW
jgi:hypothetical protein